MNIGLIGTDHTHLALTIREKFCFTEERLHLFLKQFPTQSLITELVVLSTCNRIEFYFVSDDIKAAGDWLETFVLKFHHTYSDDLPGTLLRCDGDKVVSHLFEVVSGIKSLVFGENEILGQIKDAYRLSHKYGRTGSIFNKLFQKATAVGKRVREETLIGRGAYSISSIAVEDIRREYGDHFNDKKILIIGAGTIGLRALRKLLALKHPSTFIMNRSEEKLVRIHEKYRVPVVPFDELCKTVAYDVIIVATDASHYILTPECVSKTGPKIRVIDLSVPRNVDPKIAKMDRVELITMDEIKAVSDTNVEKKRNELDKIQVIIDQEFGEFAHWYVTKQQLCSSD